MESGDKIWVEGTITRMPSEHYPPENQSYAMRTKDGQNIETNIGNVVDPEAYKKKGKERKEVENRKETENKKEPSETKHFAGPSETK